MPQGPKQTWNSPPDFGDNIQQDWATWLTNAVNRLQGPIIQPTPTNVTTISHPGGVQLVWNEVNQALAYSLYETATAVQPPGVPIATVPANRGTLSNSYLRAGLNDTVARFYSVVTITQYGRSVASTPASGAALITTAPVIPLSGTPVNKNGIGGGLGGGGGIFGKGQGPQY